MEIQLICSFVQIIRCSSINIHILLERHIYINELNFLLFHIDLESIYYCWIVVVFTKVGCCRLLKKFKLHWFYYGQGGLVMSGSDGGYSGSGGGFHDSCEDLVIDTQLSSPKADVISKLQVHSLLDITIHRNEQNAEIVVALYEGEIAGGVTSPQIFQLKKCIQNGTVYEGDVLSVSGGQVRVKIKAKK